MTIAEAKGKGALLEPEDWEKLIAEKEWKLATARGGTETAVPASRIGPSYDVLRRNSLVDGIYGVVESASCAVRALAQLAGRKTAEYQAEVLLRRLLSTYGGKYTDGLRHELLQLHK